MSDVSKRLDGSRCHLVGRPRLTAHGIVLNGDPAPSKKMHSLTNFRPMYIVAKRSPISATAAWALVLVLSGRLSWLAVSFLKLLAHVSTFHKEFSYERIAQDEQREVKHYSLHKLCKTWSVAWDLYTKKNRQDIELGHCHACSEKLRKKAGNCGAAIWSLNLLKLLQREGSIL